MELQYGKMHLQEEKWTYKMEKCICKRKNGDARWKNAFAGKKNGDASRKNVFAGKKNGDASRKNAFARRKMEMQVGKMQLQEEKWRCSWKNAFARRKMEMQLEKCICSDSK